MNATRPATPQKHSKATLPALQDENPSFLATLGYRLDTIFLDKSFEVSRPFLSFLYFLVVKTHFLPQTARPCRNAARATLDMKSLLARHLCRALDLGCGLAPLEETDLCALALAGDTKQSLQRRSQTEGGDRNQAEKQGGFVGSAWG